MQLRSDTLKALLNVVQAAENAHRVEFREPLMHLEFTQPRQLVRLWGPVTMYRDEPEGHHEERTAEAGKEIERLFQPLQKLWFWE